jgi:hypothetical protein
MSEESIIATVVAGVICGLGLAFRRWRKRRKAKRAQRRGD